MDSGMQQTPTVNNRAVAVDDREPFLSVVDLKAHYLTADGTVKAVDGVSFEIYPGQTLGIVGESGCGKTTVGRSILQVLDTPGEIVDGEVLWRRQPEDGEDYIVDVAWEQRDSQEMRSIRGNEVALIFQEPMASFSPIHTVWNQMVEMIMLHNDISKEEAGQRAIELLRMVGIPDPEQRVNQLSFQLSGGMRQRAMIAMAISCNPKLLIADEPTTAQDVTTQAQILDLLRKIQKEQETAILLITHDLGVIAEMCDNVVVMYLGRGVETGSVDEIFHDPKHPYTQALLRSIPSVQVKGQHRLPTITGSVPHPFRRPPGCPFHPRCAAFMEGICDAHEPQFLPIEGTKQHVRCFLHHRP